LDHESTKLVKAQRKISDEQNFLGCFYWTELLKISTCVKNTQVQKGEEFNNSSPFFIYI
jgi:hypothetical protein